MEYTLQLVFRNSQGNMSTISIPAPLEDLEVADVEAVMDQILAAGVVITAGGPLVSKVRAQLVARDVQELVSF